MTAWHRDRCHPERAPSALSSRASAERAVIPSERRPPFVIPSERSESRDLHIPTSPINEL